MFFLNKKFLSISRCNLGIPIAETVNEMHICIFPIREYSRYFDMKFEQVTNINDENYFELTFQIGIQPSHVVLPTKNLCNAICL